MKKRKTNQGEDVYFRIQAIDTVIGKRYYVQKKWICFWFNIDWFYDYQTAHERMVRWNKDKIAVRNFKPKKTTHIYP